MTLPIRALPIVEKWTCHGCGLCCRGTFFALSDEDLRRLAEQGWQQRPEFRGVPILVRMGLWGRKYRLAKRRDGSCVFLTPEGLCRIHQEYGEPAKPLICRMFPFQLVPLEHHACLTLRRYCPSAAAGKGEAVAEQLGTVRRLAEEGGLAVRAPEPPPIAGRVRRPWRDFLLAAEALERLMLDARYPHVRRLVHGLQFCHLLSQCRLGKLSDRGLAELVAMLEPAAVAESSRFFDERRAPGRAAALMFRQSALEYVRLHPKLHLEHSWRERWRMVRLALAFARGRGPVSPLSADFPRATFEALERPLGHLGAEVLLPLATYFETAALSKHYALLGRRWPLVESFRALALVHPIALWLVRLSAGDRPPQASDTIDAVAAVDRGQSDPTLCGWRHRRRVASLVPLDELARLVVWYAR